MESPGERVLLGRDPWHDLSGGRVQGARDAEGSKLNINHWNWAMNNHGGVLHCTACLLKPGGSGTNEVSGQLTFALPDSALADAL